MLGLLLGVGVGAFTNPEFAQTWFRPLGDLFIRLIRMVVVPLVFATLVAGAAGISDVSKLGRVAVRTLVLFMVTSAISVVFGLVIANLIEPGVGVTLSTEADTAGAYELLHSETDDKKADDTASQDSAVQTAADGDVTIYYAEDGTPLTDDEGYYIDEDGDRVLTAVGVPVKDPSAPAKSGEDTPETDAVGEQIVLSLHLLVNADNAFKVAAAAQLAASWNAVEGVSVTVDAVDYETFTARIREGSFDLYYGETRLTPDFDLRPLLTQGGSLNFGGYHDPDMERTLAAARKSGDRSALCKQFAEQMPFIPIAFEREQVIIRKILINGCSPAPYSVFFGQENWTRGYAAESGSDAQTDEAAQ